jgi:ATP-dependent RNA helicase DDX41
MRMPLQRGDGPIGIIMAPSRELARQTAELAQHFAAHLKAQGYPELRTMLAIGEWIGTGGRLRNGARYL